MPVVDAASLLAGYEPTIVDRCSNDTFFDRYFGDYTVCLRAVVGAVESGAIGAAIQRQENGQPHWGQTKISREGLIRWLRQKRHLGGYFGDEVAALSEAENNTEIAIASRLSHWDVAVQFKGHEAAKLIVGIDPAHPSNEWWRAEPTIRRMEEAYEAARTLCSDAARAGENYDARFRAARGSALISVAMKSVVSMQDDKDEETITWLTMNRWLDAQGSLFPHQQFDRDELHRWVIENRIRSAYIFRKGGRTSLGESKTPVVFSSYNPIVDVAPDWPMPALDQIAVNAVHAAESFGIRDVEIFRAVGLFVLDQINDEKAGYLEEASEFYSEREQHLRAAAGDEPFTEIDQPPDRVDESEPRTLDVEDISDVEALRNCFDYDRFDFLGFNDQFKDVRFEAAFSVLALMKVEAALRCLGWQKGNRWLRPEDVSIAGLADAANAALEAQEALLLGGDAAEQALHSVGGGLSVSEFRGEKPRAQAQFSEPTSNRRTRAELAAEALQKKNQKLNDARDWSWDEWARIGETHYQKNKSQFYDDYLSVKLPVMFKTAGGQNLSISKKQATEVWLKSRRPGRT